MIIPNSYNFHTVEPIWQDQPAYIIGGGPSLIGFDFNKLRSKNTIAVKQVAEHIPWCSYYFSIDAYTALQRYGELRWFLGKKIIAVKPDFRLASHFKGIDLIIKDNEQLPPKLSFKQDRVSGYNSGFGALNYAVLLGANPIYILGIDLVKGGYWFDPKSTHWKDSRIVSGQLQTRDTYIKEINDDFAVAAKQCLERNISVYSNSLSCFRYCDGD